MDRSYVISRHVIYVSVTFSNHQDRGTVYSCGRSKMKRDIRRGDIYYAKLPDEEIGSVQSGIRPVLITQSNRLNRTSTTVIVAIVTSKLKRPNELTHVVLPLMDGLPKQSMVEAEQRKTISKAQLLDYCCTIDEETMKEVTRALHYSEEPDGRDKYRMKRKTQRNVHCAK